MYTNVSKPTGADYTSTNPEGKQQYDQATITYDDSTVFYDSINYNSYSFATTPSVAWNIGVAAFNQSTSIAAQTTRPEAVFFSSDGVSMYVLDGLIGQTMYQYSLSTAWNISTKSLLRTLDLSAHITTYNGAMFFRPDGLKMYVTDAILTGGTINEYDLSTAWDISTSSWVRLFNVSNEGSSPEGIYFNPEGMKMFILGYEQKEVNEYDLEVAWNISTASFRQSKSLSGDITQPDNLFFKPDGKKMYIVQGSISKIFEYSLSEQWDIATAVFLQTFSISLLDLDVFSIFFKPDGLSFYITLAVGDLVSQYNMTESYTKVVKPIT